MVFLRQLEQNMQTFPRYLNSSVSTVWSKQRSNNQRIIPSSTLLHYRTLLPKRKSKEDGKKEAAEKHSMAERVRRKRINLHYDALRAALPNLEKMDKASVLEATIRHVKELQKKAKEVEAALGGGTKSTLPQLANDLKCVKDGGLVRVVFSCEDRKELIAEVARAVSIVKGRIIRAEMIMVGGRSKFMLWVQGFTGSEGTGLLRRALNSLVYKSFENYKKPRYIQ